MKDDTVNSLMAHTDYSHFIFGGGVTLFDTWLKKLKNGVVPTVVLHGGLLGETTPPTAVNVFTSCCMRVGQKMCKFQCDKTVLRIDVGIRKIRV